jgi:predicted transcriptional regulator
VSRPLRWLAGEVKTPPMSVEAPREMGFLKLTQAALAKVLHTSQSRLAKMESGDASVSLDLLFKSLFSLGITRKNPLSSGRGD